MPPVKRKRRKARRPGARSQTHSSSNLRRVLYLTAEAVGRCAAFLSRVLFRMRGAVAILLTASLFGVGILIFKEKVMDRFEQGLPAAINIKSDNAELQQILEPSILQLLHHANKKDWNRQRFDRAVTKALSSEPGVLGAVLRYQIGGRLSIIVTAQDPAFALSDSSGTRYVFSPAGRLIGKAPVRGLKPARIAIVLQDEVLKFRSGKGVTKAGPVSTLLRRAHTLSQALTSAKISILGPIEHAYDPGLSLCARVAEMNADSCIEVIFGQDKPSQESFQYLREELQTLAATQVTRWPKSIDFALRDRVLVRGLGSHTNSATSQTSRDVE